MAKKASLEQHELLGLFYQFLGATSLGVGAYYALWFAIRPLYYESAIALSNIEWLLFPLFFGLGFVLLSIGHIQIKEAKPRK